VNATVVVPSVTSLSPIFTLLFWAAGGQGGWRASGQSVARRQGMRVLSYLDSKPSLESGAEDEDVENNRAKLTSCVLVSNDIKAHIQ